MSLGVPRKNKKYVDAELSGKSNTAAELIDFVK
jgi:hypothetical protein